MWSFIKNKLTKQKDFRSKDKNLKKPSIIIKIPVSKWKRAHSWGDYHMAVLLKKQLELIGHPVLIQVSSEWDNKESKEYDVAIVFRGPKRYTLKPNQINILWNISHPDSISLKEYQNYDHIFIASDYWAKKISNELTTPVESMWQCTDPDRFKPVTNKEKNQYQHQLLFVGNSRKITRKIISDLLPTKYELAVYGQDWEKLIPKHYIKAQYINNDEVFKYYASADILLNDHWDDMREKGFSSNRIFDGLACGAFIITDKVHSMNELEKYVKTYNSKRDLQLLIEYYLNNPNERRAIAQKGKKFVIENHTFKQRAKRFSEVIDLLTESRNLI
jgi:spore maturation protein CgeB